MFYHSTLRGPGILSMEIGKDAWALKHFLVMQVATLTTGVLHLRVEQLHAFKAAILNTLTV